jgi:hypothetical protein
LEKSLLKTLMLSEFGQNRQSIQLENSRRQFRMENLVCLIKNRNVVPHEIV